MALNERMLERGFQSADRDLLADEADLAGDFV